MFAPQYRYTRNTTFLQTQSYPFLRAVAAWWVCWLKKDPAPFGSSSGYVYNDRPDCTREECNGDGGDVNPGISIAFIRFILGHLIEV